jgi:hypothetical protein
MFGPRFSSLFKSRWMALLWAIWISLMAIGYVGSGSKTGDQSGGNSMDAIANALGG